MYKNANLKVLQSSVLKLTFKSKRYKTSARVLDYQGGYSVLFKIGSEEYGLCYSTKNVNRENSGKVRVFKNYQGALTAIKNLGYSGDVIVSV